MPKWPKRLQKVKTMPARLILVTGGCRSGKSGFARRLVENSGHDRCFLATCPVFDDETAERVRRHREERADSGWRTIEEEVEVTQALAAAPPQAAILLDCLTLWVNNLMHRGESSGGWPDEDAVAALAGELAAAARKRDGLFVAVTNEVGMGIVPENAAARRFRDLAGRVNQTMAAASDEAYFLVSGLAWRIK